jgi:hypothetical protein
MPDCIVLLFVFHLNINFKFKCKSILIAFLFLSPSFSHGLAHLLIFLLLFSPLPERPIWSGPFSFSSPARPILPPHLPLSLRGPAAHPGTKPPTPPFFLLPLALTAGARLSGSSPFSAPDSGSHSSRARPPSRGTSGPHANAPPRPPYKYRQCPRVFPSSRNRRCLKP